MRFVIVDGLPYLYEGGKAYKCRFDDEGFTPTQEEIELNNIPAEVYSELEIKAQCACLDSIADRAAETSEYVESGGNGGADTEVVEDSEGAEKSDFGNYTLEELKEYAKQHEIKLGSARTKAEIIEKIAAE